MSSVYGLLASRFTIVNLCSGFPSMSVFVLFGTRITCECLFNACTIVALIHWNATDANTAVFMFVFVHDMNASFESNPSCGTLSIVATKFLLYEKFLFINATASSCVYVSFCDFSMSFIIDILKFARSVSYLSNAFNSPSLPYCIKSSNSRPIFLYLFAHSIACFKLFFINISLFSGKNCRLSCSCTGCFIYSALTSSKYMSMLLLCFLSFIIKFAILLLTCFRRFLRYSSFQSNTLSAISFSILRK